MREILVGLYPDPRDARRFISDLNVDPQQFDFSGRPRTFWHEIVTELDRRNNLGDALQVAKKEYPSEAIERLLQHSTPQPNTSPGAHVPPPGGAYDRGAYVPRLDLERRAREFLVNPGTPLVIQGPAATGKTWLVEHLLDGVRAAPGARIARVNLRQIPHEDRGNFLSFSEALLRVLGRALNMKDMVLSLATDARLTPMTRVTDLVEGALLETDGNVYAVLDIPDDVLAWEKWHDIEGMLRSWHELAAEEPWNRLRIILVLSTSPALATRSIRGSPFRVSPIHVGDFSIWEVDALAAQFGVPLAPADRAKVMAVVGGHPMLLAAVLQGARNGLDLAVACRPRDNPMLGDALSQAAPRLRDHPELVDLMASITRTPGFVPTLAQQHDVDVLESAGLVQRGESDWSVRLPIFEELLR